MATTPQTQYEIPKGGYIAFDAMSLRQLIVNRLNDQQVFTDQNFVGSNLASIIDIIAYSYNTLIYYLNRTSTESMFTEAQIYENMNRIVKLVDYNPVGFQTSTLTFNCSAQNLTQGIYTIPRYSFFAVNSTPFSFNEDVTFVKQTNTLEDLAELAQQKLLFQGKYQEYPTYTAAGDNNEILTVDTTGQLVDHFNIDVYVKSTTTNTWKQYTKTTNLYLENGIAEKYEIRLNGNKRYEIKFGNNINGKKLETGDQVAVYYLVSDGKNGEIGAEALTNIKLNKYSTVRFDQVLTDVSNSQFNYLTNSQINGLSFFNSTASTLSQEGDTVEQIRETAPANYRSQYRLVTTNDYKTFIKTNFANLISDANVVNNWDYVSGYLKYFYDIGIDTPTKTDRALLNQVLYSDACNFNNIYLIVVPKTSAAGTYNYLLPAQKELIETAVQATKIATTETAFIDPIYKAVAFGLDYTNTPEPSNEDFYLEIVKSDVSRRNSQGIIDEACNIIKNYFDRANLALGQTLDIRELTQQILNIEGVTTFYTVDSNDSTNRSEGLSFAVWNPVYPDNDKIITQNNITFKYFEYPYYYNTNNLPNLIRVRTETTLYNTTEY